MYQLSGLPNRQYKLRFALAMGALEHALTHLGAELCDDGTGMAYVVVKEGRRIGGPASCAEEAVCIAMSRGLGKAQRHERP